MKFFAIIVCIFFVFVNQLQFNFARTLTSKENVIKMKSNQMNLHKPEPMAPPNENGSPLEAMQMWPKKIRNLKKRTACLSGIGGIGCNNHRISTERSLVDHNNRDNYKNP